MLPSVFLIIEIPIDVCLQISDFVFNLKIINKKY